MSYLTMAKAYTDYAKNFGSPELLMVKEVCKHLSPNMGIYDIYDPEQDSVKVINPEDLSEQEIVKEIANDNPDINTVRISIYNHPKYGQVYEVQFVGSSQEMYIYPS